MAKKKPQGRKKARSSGGRRSAPRKLAQPKRELEKVKQEIRQVRNPLYALNRKIKQAPSRYQERKLKKQRNTYLQENDQRLSGLINKRTELQTQIKEFSKFKREKESIKAKAKRLEKKLDDLAGSRNYKEAEKLRLQVLKLLGQIDDLDRKMGAEIKKPDLTKIDREELNEEGGEGFEIDMRSPYAIWEAIKQLEADLKGGEFDFYVINGRRFKSDNPIQITANASVFWLASKRKTNGTPYINRYINFEEKAVKYLYFNS